MAGLAVNSFNQLHSAGFNHYMTGDIKVKRANTMQAEKAAPSKEKNLHILARGDKDHERQVSLSRRSGLGLALAGLTSSMVPVEQAFAASSGAVAGRVPGLSDVGDDGLRTYKRPPGKSGGHGVGWSEFIPYSFKVSDGWEEVPVSIADLGGTEIDLRFSSKEGKLSVVVAPLLRFSDGLGDNARIEDIGPPDRVIYAFGPELTGETVEGRVKGMEVSKLDGRTYYQYELDPHFLVSATAAGNRLYIITVSASGRQWKKYADELKDIAKSFRVG